MVYSLSYREVIPNNISVEEWTDVVINTGTQHTLQDIKTCERSGGYSYRNVEQIQNRNRFIYWRAYRNILELSEISLDCNLSNNNLRLRFTDTAVLAVSITEQDQYIVLLVATISSIHYFNFPYKNGDTVYTFQPAHSVFHDIRNSEHFNEPSTYYVIDGNGVIQQHLPHAAACYVSPDGNEAFYALAYQTKLMLYIRNLETHSVACHEVKQSQLMPRFLTNLKGALTGRSDNSNDYAVSVIFNDINDEVYMVALYRNDMLRLWSTTTLEPVCSMNCQRSSDNPAELTQGPQNSSLRKINNLSLCVYLSYAIISEFICIEIAPDITDDNETPELSFVRCRTVLAPQMDLADFGVSESRIWVLWNSANGEFSISSMPIQHNLGLEWVTAALEPPPDRYCLSIEQGVDPREAYCSYIFHPGKFERNVIVKALYMFKRVNMHFDMNQLTITLLKEQVCQAVEDEIRNEMKEFLVSDEEYLEIATRLWERFYSCCEQYHMKYAEPTGLVILEGIDSVCVVRKQAFSLLRPCDVLEHLMLVSEDAEMDIVVEKYFADNYTLGKDFVQLVVILSQIEKWLPEDTKMDLDKRLYQLEMSTVLIKNITDEILSGNLDRPLVPPNFLTCLQQYLQPINDICAAVALLHEALRVGGDEEEPPSYEELNYTSRHLISLGSLFGSEYGLSILTDSVRQTALMRYAICRNLLILKQIIIDTLAFPLDVVEHLRTNLMPDSVIYLQAYYILVWLAETSVSLNTPSTLESSMQHLSRAQLQRDRVPRIYSNFNKLLGSTTLLHLFLKSKCLHTAQQRLISGNEYKPREFGLQHTLLPLIRYVNDIVWVVGYDFTFGEWLLSSCQHVIIQDYVRLLSNWCEWNSFSRLFMLAVSLLDCGETHKAYELFLQCSRGVLKEKFLFERILHNTPLYEQLQDVIGPAMNSVDHAPETSNQAFTFYYLKIIQLFEQHQALNYVIRFAETALGTLSEDDPHLPMFQSIIFNNHLILEHYQEAYHSLIYNTDASRRKDCLRQLVVNLFQNKRLDLLMHFPYKGLTVEFEDIVESRARSLSMDQNEVYDFLYAYHVNNENMRKACAIMYEQALRLQLEPDAPDALERRCHALLVCINCMQLTDEDYRWVVKPVMGDEIPAQNKEQLVKGLNQEIEVLELADVRRELLHAEALRELSIHCKNTKEYADVSASDLAYLLANTRLYTSALKIANGFDVAKEPIFDLLTLACVKASDENNADTWTWLQENDLSDLPTRTKAADMAWSFLQYLLEEYELENSTNLRKSVVYTLLSSNAFVPLWLHNSYKLSNCSELLYSYVKHNRLLEATELAIEMLVGMLGSGCEYFSFKHGIALTEPPLSLPINTLDLLLHGLSLNANTNIEYKLAKVKLEDYIKRYVEAAMCVTDEKIHGSGHRRIKS